MDHIKTRQPLRAEVLSAMHGHLHNFYLKNESVYGIKAFAISIQAFSDISFDDWGYWTKKLSQIERFQGHKRPDQQQLMTRMMTVDHW